MASDLARHWTLDPEVHFLNHGSFGACPRAVLEAQAELRARLEAEPVRFFLRELPELADRARRTLAELVGAEARDVAFVSNATEGVNAVLRSLELSAADRLLVCDQAYNACANAVRFVAGRVGAQVDVAPLPFPVGSMDEAYDAVMAGVREDTKLVLLDWISSPTGLVLPIERLVRDLRGRGVLTLVDAAHAVGQVPVDLGALDADFVTSNCHKWMCTPKGSAFLWVRREHQDWVRPVVISHGANAPLGERSRFQVEFGWTGTDDPTAMLTLPVALELLSSLRPGGLEAHRAANRALALEARDLLCEALGVPAPQPDEMVACLAAVPLPDDPAPAVRDALDTSPLQDRLLHEHRVEVPIVTWPAAPKRLLRVSAQAYNDRGDYEVLAAALPALLAGEGGP